ncbi:MAG: hypothetical protein JXD23_13520 [Spirochaetales bacterium]|nr:hypothetical protein [Spirochaetales bacterium]
MSHSLPFCPNRDCAFHHAPPGDGWFRPYGVYRTKAYGTVKRYACRLCGKSFSRRTFRLSYYLHLHVSFRDILYGLASCSGLRAMARRYGVTDKVISNRIGRLARQAIGTTAGLRPTQRSTEALAADGFESFVLSQYCPVDIHHLIGADSQYVHACDLAHFRRKGRTTDYQKRKRERLEKTFGGVSGEIFASFERICRAIDDLPRPSGTIDLHTDEKREYRAVLAANGFLDGKVRRHTTSSRKARTSWNPLWPVNYYDRELRKDQASMVRETTRWSQETNNCMERTYAYAAHHNLYKPFRIRQRDDRTHAEMAGFDVRKIEFLKRRFFRERYFYTKVSFNASEWLVWLRAYHTPFSAGWRELPKYVTGEERRRPSRLAA